MIRFLSGTSLRLYLAALCLLATPALLAAQSTPARGSKPPAAPKKAQTAKPLSPVDKVINMAKSGLSEDLIIRAIAKDNLHADLGSDDMIRLKQAGVSDRVISALDAPSTSSGPAPASPAPPPAAASPSLAPASVSVDPRAQMRRAAIDEFDWASVKTVVNQIFQTNVDIGKGIRALLTKRVQEGGKIRIVERAKIKTVEGEQDFGASNRVKKGTNARIGQILGADAYLMGDIVVFGRDDARKGVGLGVIPGVPRVFGGVQVGKSEGKAVIVISYRLVDAETSEIIDAGEARGESKRQSKGFAGLFAWPGGAVGGSVDMTSSNFAETIIGEAVIDACDKLAVVMNAKIPGLAKRQVDVEARVADVSGGTVTIAAGSNDGVSVGDRFEVFRILSEIKDPVTGEVLDNKVDKVGELVITSVRDRVASGQYSGGPVDAKTGLARKRAQ